MANDNKKKYDELNKKKPGKSFYDDVIIFSGNANI